MGLRDVQINVKMMGVQNLVKLIKNFAENRGDLVIWVYLVRKILKLDMPQNYMGFTKYLKFGIEIKKD